MGLAATGSADSSVGRCTAVGAPPESEPSEKPDHQGEKEKEFSAGAASAGAKDARQRGRHNGQLLWVRLPTGLLKRALNGGKNQVCPKRASCLICQNLCSKHECIGDISDIRNTHVMPEAICTAIGTSALAKEVVVNHLRDRRSRLGYPTQSA